MKLIEKQKKQWLDQQLNAEKWARDIVADTQVVIDASHEEYSALWYKYHHHWGVPWDQEGRGLMRQIGEGMSCGEKLPLWVTVWFARVGPAMVAFVGSDARLVDYSLIDEWSRVVFPCMHPGHWGHHTNATNFGNAVNSIQDHYKVRLIDRARVDRAERIGEWS